MLQYLILSASSTGNKGIHTMSLENNPQNNIETKINHSGNATEAMRETPVNDFDNTTLQEAVDQNLIGTPKTTEAIGSWAPSTETMPSTVEKKGFTKKQKLIAGISGAALALGIGAGLKSMGSSDEQIAPVGPVATAEMTPSATVTPEATATPPETVAPVINAEIAANVELNKNSPIEVFNKRPRDERLAFVWDRYNYLASTGDLSEFMRTETLNSGAIYLHNPATPGTEPNPLDDGVRIMNNQIFAEQAAAAWKKNTSEVGDGPLDLPTATKLLSGLTYEVGSKDKSGQYADTLKYVLEASPNAQQELGFEKTSVYATSDLKKGVDVDNKPIDYKDVIYTAGIGKTYEARFVYKTFIGSDSQEHSLWLMLSEKIATKISF